MQCMPGLLRPRLRPGKQFRSLCLSYCGGVCLTGRQLLLQQKAGTLSFRSTFTLPFYINLFLCFFLTFISDSPLSVVSLFSISDLGEM